MARALLASGANPRIANDRLGTPRDLALKKGHLAVADLLRQSDATE